VTAVKPQRRYVSPRRAEGARQTQRAILDAARELFLAQGYVATSVDQIAERARVSKPTVFAAVGSKRDVLKLLRDHALAGDDAPVSVTQRTWVQEVLAEPDPARTLRLYARGGTALQARYADLDAVLRAAAAADEELGDLWRVSEQERLEAAGRFVDNLLAKGPLRPGLERAEAVDVMWLYMASENLRRLVGERGWSLARFEEWLADTLCAQLLP
jgi:AcrR family transcriptional regulator